MEDKIVKHLKERYDPISIISYGSRALGTAKPHSDWDLLLFLDQDKIPKEPGGEKLDGQYLDLSFIALLPFTEEYIVKRFRRSIGTIGAPNGAKVLFDTDGVGEDFLKETRLVYEKGRNLSEKEKQNRKNFLSRRLNKLEDSLNDGAMFFYHLGYFFEKAIQYWFEILHNRWSPTPSLALTEIKNDDPKYHELLEVLCSGKDSGIKIKAAGKILSRITE